MSTNTGRPPDLTNVSLAKLVQHLFPFHSVEQESFQQLDSYDDRNYSYTGSLDDGSPLEYVLKIYNYLNNLPEVVCGVSSLMSYLHRQGFQGVEQIVNREGSTIAMVTNKDLIRVTGEKCDEGVEGFVYCVRVVRFVSGQTLDSIGSEHVTSKLLFEIGQYLGRIDTALCEAFTDEAISKRVLANFDLMHFQTMHCKYLSTVEDPDRQRMARAVFTGYKTHVVPKLSSFRRGVIYNDAHTSNIIVTRLQDKDQVRVAAFIDFDDAVNSYYVFELAVLLADLIGENIHSTQPLQFVAPVISGYCQEFKLCEEECSSLYYLVMARCCQLGMVTGEQYKREPWNKYLFLSLDTPWKVIDLLLRTEEQEVNSIWTNAVHRTVDDYL